jgi:hypothetical protein
MGKRTIASFGVAIGLALACLFATASSAITPPHCSTRDFSISEAPSSQGAGGSFYLALAFRNHASRVCGTGGFPGVTLLGANRRSLGVAKRSGKNKLPILDVRPGKHLYDVIQYGETPVEGSGCHAVKAVRVFPPGNTRQTVIRLPHGSQDCARFIVVYPLARSVLQSHNGG